MSRPGFAASVEMQLDDAPKASAPFPVPTAPFMRMSRLVPVALTKRTLALFAVLVVVSCPRPGPATPNPSELSLEQAPSATEAVSRAVVMMRACMFLLCGKRRSGRGARGFALRPEGKTLAIHG